MCLPNILLPVFMFAFIFHCRSFSPCRAASISHFLTAALNFHVFLPTKFVSFVFNYSLQLFLCYPRQCKHKKYVERDLHTVMSIQNDIIHESCVFIRRMIYVNVYWTPLLMVSTRRYTGQLNTINQELLSPFSTDPFPS